MQYIYSALLLHSAGKEATEETVTAVLSAAGVEVDSGRVKALVAALEGANIDEAIEAATAAPVAVAGAAAPAEAEAAPEEEEDEGVSEDEAAAGLGALFG
jgi:large subunit ribosomal protein L12